MNHRLFLVDASYVQVGLAPPRIAQNHIVNEELVFRVSRISAVAFLLPGYQFFFIHVVDETMMIDN